MNEAKTAILERLKDKNVDDGAMLGLAQAYVTLCTAERLEREEAEVRVRRGTPATLSPPGLPLPPMPTPRI